MRMWWKEKKAYQISQSVFEVREEYTWGLVGMPFEM